MDKAQYLKTMVEMRTDLTCKKENLEDQVKETTLIIRTIDDRIMETMTILMQEREHERIEGKICAKCYGRVFKSDLEEYVAQCFVCDENFYLFELSDPL